MDGQIVASTSSGSGSRIELEPHYVRIFFNNYQKSDFINRVPDWPKSTLKLVFSPEEKTVNLYGNLIYVSNLNKSWVAEQKNFSFSYFVPLNRLRFIQIDSSLRKHKKSSTITNSFSFKLGIDDAKRLFKDLQMGHQAIEKRFSSSNCDDAKSKPNKLELTTVLVYLDKLSQKDLQGLVNMYPTYKFRMDKLSEHTLLYGENNGPPPPIPLQKCLKIKIKKMTILDELKSGGFKITGKLVISFSARRIDFFETIHGTRLEHFIKKPQILGFELINNSNKLSTIHIAVNLQVACLICSKLIRPVPPMKVIKMMIKEFRKGEKSGEMSHCIVRIQFRRKLKQEEIEHFKHFYPDIGNFPASTTSCEEENINLAKDDEAMNLNDDSVIEKTTTDQLSESESEEELKPLNLDIRKMKIGQHTICYSSPKFNHYITLIVDDEHLRIIGNGQISQYIEEKVYFYFKIPINSPEIDRQYEVAAVAGLKSRIKFSLSSEESNYVRGLFKKSLGFYGIDKDVDLTRFEFILATELNGLQLAHLRSIENLNLITKSEKKCFQVKTEIQEEQMDMEKLIFGKEKFETDTDFSVRFERMYFGQNFRHLKLKRGYDQNLNIVINQNNSTIKLIGDLKNRNKATWTYLEFSISWSRYNVYTRSIKKCERILECWQNSRNDGGLNSFQKKCQLCLNEEIFLKCQSIHFGQYVYRGENTFRILIRQESTFINIHMRDFEDQGMVSLVLSGPPVSGFENYQVKYFLSDYGVNHWTLFFIPHPKCQGSFASKLKYPQLTNLFDPCSEDMGKSYIRLVFEFPPNLQERDKKIEFCNKLNDIFDTYILSYIDLVAERNIKIIEKNLGQKNNQSCMETG